MCCVGCTNTSNCVGCGLCSFSFLQSGSPDRLLCSLSFWDFGGADSFQAASPTPFPLLWEAGAR